MRKSRKSVIRARRLRRRLSLPEGLLWRELRPRPRGFKFRRQHPIDPYSLDFFCHEAALAIEVDGVSHDMGDNPQRDEARDAWVKDLGILTIRIAAADVLSDLEAVMKLIVLTCEKRSP
jgi:very-short-patch-repair endonuclease